MPLYDMFCGCGYSGENLYKNQQEADKARCPNCTGNLTRKISGFNIGGSSKGNQQSNLESPDSIIVEAVTPCGLRVMIMISKEGSGEENRKARNKSLLTGLDN